MDLDLTVLAIAWTLVEALEGLWAGLVWTALVTTWAALVATISGMATLDVTGMTVDKMCALDTTEVCLRSRALCSGWMAHPRAREADTANKMVTLVKFCILQKQTMK